MGAGLLLVTAVAYLGVAGSYFQAGRLGMCFAFVAYACANLGFALDVWLWRTP